MQINIAPKYILDKTLERKKKDAYRPEYIDLKAMLKEILTLANRFVPSESGSILLDDPILNQNRQKAGVLHFVACFGKGSSALMETILPVKIGIAGRTYSSGRVYISKKAREDKHFFPAMDQKTKFVTKSIVCAPIRIKGATIGVIELINRVDRINYDQTDLNLLKIFAEYTSTLIQNLLDARRFGELSIRDNLTGLYNDRYFYDRLTKDISRALKKRSDLSLLFLDLDRFKEVNDSHGHLAGSRVLVEVGALIFESVFRLRTATAARYGGDEFVVILPGLDAGAAGEVAERLRETIEKSTFLKTRFHGGRAIKLKGHITCSIGVSTLKSCPTGQMRDVRESIIKKADSAMYRSKESGKNRVTISD
ncbi:MAG: sensor domain-containing diguanylate cyclase [Deltaproteobacteria bacterium]|nr:sensor domain-containing diguanylate cyclase [Deltaproteobacteria bacterium]